MKNELEIIKQNIHLFNSLSKYLKNLFKVDQEPKISFIINKKNADNPLGKTAYYSPDEMKISVYILGRHIKDIYRSYAHEYIHHIQNCRGEFSETTKIEKNYAQNDEHLQEMEREAYEKGSMAFRNWEDQLKGQKGIEPNEDK